jgi:ABC-type Zn uptake system ZnuABC Zn-binding protein ZnuA
VNGDQVVASPRLRLDIRTIVVIRWARLELGRLLAAGRGGLAILFVVLVAACSSGSASQSGSPASGQIDVVATTTVFSDLVKQVGGSHVRAASLVPRGGDVHTFEPKPGDVQTISGAKLLVMNGLGLDDWLEDTITTASASGTPVVKLGEGLTDVELLPGEDPGTRNPHLFMDVTYVERYVDEIAAALQRVDPANAADYAGAAASYKTRLAALDASVRQKIATIPEANRKIVTFHDAFPYYAREYGITIVGTAVSAPGQDPTAGYTAELIDEIKASGVKAIFSEDQFPTKLVDQLAEETGAKVVANLYDDSVGDPPVDTYEGVISWDTDQLVAALK